MTTTFSNSQVTILWSTKETLPFYVDFEVEGVAGIFRVADSDGVDLHKVLPHIERNRDFFLHFLEVGGRVFSEAKKFTNWGNGWEWEENFHCTQGKDYRLTSATLWYTTPFGSRGNSGVISMESLYKNKVQEEGVKLLYSWNSNRQPSVVCYFFPYS
ncbi:MAG: hypothetical protein WA919_11045 [Coleofasciculaceae cyanobacterium]